MESEVWRTRVSPLAQRSFSSQTDIIHNNQIRCTKEGNEIKIKRQIERDNQESIWWTNFEVAFQGEVSLCRGTMDGSTLGSQLQDYLSS